MERSLEAQRLEYSQRRMVAVPLVIVAVYAVTLLVLERRWRRLQQDPAARSLSLPGGAAGMKA